MNEYNKPIAETNNFIVLDRYTKISQINEPYQSENALEREFVKDLVNLGYVYRDDIKTYDDMLKNIKDKLEKLNSVKFSESEWERFVKEYLDKANEGIIEKTKKVHNDYIKDFVFDDGHIENVYLFDKKNLLRNSLEVIRQFSQKGKYLNRYDVTILINGIPVVQIELKKRGVALKEAFNQIHRYSKESFNGENSLYKFLQLFVISNGTDTRYFANTTKRNKNSFDFTMNWATSKNEPIKDLKDFTATFFQKNTLLNVVFKYSVFDTTNTLLIMRPYQIAASERILWKIKSAYEAKKQGSIEAGGYIWHTTGSGKTLTSFKASKLACELEFVDKVLFVVDRKDLDYQTMKEYQKFSPDSVNGSENTAGLKRNLLKNDNKIVVTTIQKLNNLVKSEKNLEIYKKNVVFIFDEAHRSQFGEAQKNIKKRFKNYFMFGFTGTPIFPENALGSETTASVFGRELHSYVITDAIRDEKVLKFKVDYNNVRPKFKDVEKITDEEKLSKSKEALLHPERVREISEYILKVFPKKTHRLNPASKGFNAMFAVCCVDAAKMYYETLNSLQKDSKKPLKIATIFSYAQNEEQNAVGEIEDESFEVSALNSTAKEFLAKVIDDYNKMFKTSFCVEAKSFQNYYKDISKRMKSGEIDLLIVVGMFLTGFDAPKLNTLFVDKNLKYHGLIQAYSRTNRIYDLTKPFGNIVTFRDLEQNTIDAIQLFGDKNTKNIILEKSYKEYLEGFDEKRGYIEIVKELSVKFPDPTKIESEKEKKEFVKLFGEYLKVENILQNYDEFTALKAFHKLDKTPENLEKFKQEFYLTDEDIEKFKTIPVLPERLNQDCRSVYNDIREWIKREENAVENKKDSVDWSDVVFEVELLKSQEINLDFILELIFEKNKKTKNKDEIINEITRVIRSSLGHRAKESLIVEFINKSNLDEFKEKTDIIEAFFTFAQKEMKKEAEEIIKEENLKENAAKKYIEISLKREYASDTGTELNEILPKMSPLNPKYLIKKRTVFEKISKFIEKFKGIGVEV